MAETGLTQASALTPAKPAGRQPSGDEIGGATRCRRPTAVVARSDFVATKQSPARSRESSCAHQLHLCRFAARWRWRVFCPAIDQLAIDYHSAHGHTERIACQVAAAHAVPRAPASTCSKRLTWSAARTVCCPMTSCRAHTPTSVVSPGHVTLQQHRQHGTDFHGCQFC